MSVAGAGCPLPNAPVSGSGRKMQLRKEQRLKQADLALAVGMCEKSISNIELEKNPASLETALRLAAYFKVHVDDIFHLDTEENQS